MVFPFLLSILKLLCLHEKSCETVFGRRVTVGYLRVARWLPKTFYVLMVPHWTPMPSFSPIDTVGVLEVYCIRLRTQQCYEIAQTANTDKLII